MTVNNQEQWDDQTGVIVVGAGGTGLAAALEALNNGADVILVEKNPQLGGTTSVAVGSLTAACTSLQEAAGIEDSPEWHNEDIEKFAPDLEPRNNWDLRQFFTRHAAETLEWLQSLGLTFHGPNPEPPNRVSRMHNVVPNAKAYIAILHQRILKQGGRIVLGCRAMRLVLSESGTVVGLECQTESGRWMIQAQKGIVLATGDYSNGDLVKSEFLSEEVAAVEGINPTATGDGHRLARDAGGELLNMDVVYGPEIRFIPPPKAPFAQLLPANPFLAKVMGMGMRIMPQSILNRMIKSLLVTWQHPEKSLFDQGAILINREGKRFTDETDQPELVIPKQPDKIAYIVFGQELADVFSVWPNFISTAPEIAYAYIQDYKRLRPDIYTESPTLAGLAQKLNMKPEILDTTLNEFHEALHGRKKRSIPTNQFWIPHSETALLRARPREKLDRHNRRWSADQ